MEDELASAAIALVKEGLLTKQQAINYTKEAQKQKFTFIDFLEKYSKIDSRQIALALARYFNLQFVDLDNYELSNDILGLIDLELIPKYKILPISLHNSELLIAIHDPSNYSIARDLKFYTEFTLVFVVVEGHKLNKSLNSYLYQKHQLNSNRLKYEDNIPKTEVNVEDPVVKLVDILIKSALQKGASDLHIEPLVDLYRVRYRIDGLLHTFSSIEHILAGKICSRIKIIANLNIVEHRVPQDGRFSFLADNKTTVDCRVSICPTVDGEKIVIRFLNKLNLLDLSIEALNMEDRDRFKFLEALQTTQGLILVTGPTGSGKSTTLYTAMHYLNKDAVNIISVEDPVEMNISGVNQIQINQKSGLSFATTLRAILRQDPDIIMIGEIRDLETAEIAIQAAQTGHLVLASLHTNSASQTITRLMNIGIPIYNLLNSLRLIIGQRLVRKLCEFCNNQNTYTQKLSCEKCHNGYLGRVPIFEVMSITHTLTKNLTLNDFDINEFERLACEEGMQLMKTSGLNLVRQGVTSLEEVKRVVEV